MAWKLVPVGASLEDVAEELRDLAGAYPGATVTALNRTARDVRRLGVRQGAVAMEIPAKLIRPRFKSSRATRNQRFVVFRFLRKTMAARKLNARATKRSGVRAAGGRSYPHAWIAKGVLYEQVFQRRGKERMPIDVIRVELEPVVRALDEIVAAKAPPIFEREFYRAMDQRGVIRHRGMGA
ncbi:MAG: hypothetical protein A2V88_00665 [Elusimicrobia bacterium RBG_16_66_12]|nr:MAG: hypothetical protein A2V88_00665 [Elusimicrobia bacterium RBG_16_66_12]